MESVVLIIVNFFFSSRRRHTRFSRDWSSDVCSSDLGDGVTWQAYEAELESNLAALHARVHRGAYRAPPSRRVYIAKPDGRSEERRVGKAWGCTGAPVDVKNNKESESLRSAQIADHVS